MNLGTITQNGFNLIHDIKSVPLQYSSDVPILFIKDETYIGYTAIPSIGYYDNLEEKVVNAPLSVDGTFKLPAEAFKNNGDIAIVIALSNDIETIVAGTVRLSVRKAPGGIEILPSDHNTWESLVISVMNQYNTEVITPKIDDLMDGVKEQQDVVDQKMSDLDVMVSSGAFDGSYWLSGIGVPDSKTGRDRDWYIDLDTDRWKVYRKDGDVWTDTNTYMRGADGSMGGDTVPVGSIVHFTGTSTEPGWLVCDGSEVSRKEYSKLFEVIGTSYGEGDGSKTFNLPDEPNPITYQQLENGAIQFEDRVPGVKVIIKARQDVPIVAKVENDLTSNSEDDAPSVRVVCSSFSNPNLLINSSFMNVVNQRGYSSYTANNSNLYTVDRWKLTAYGTITMLVGGGIEYKNTSALPSYFGQALDDGVLEIGKKYTVSLLVDSVVGTCNCYASRTEGSQELHRLVNGLNTYTFTHDYVKGIGFQLFSNSSLNIRWIKLEQGIIATPRVPKIVTDELIACVPFYQLFYRVGTITIDGNVNTRTRIFTPNFVSPMRKAPTMIMTEILNAAAEPRNLSLEGATTSPYGVTNFVTNGSVGTYFAYISGAFDAEIY